MDPSSAGLLKLNAMQTKEPIEFTARERHLITYYLDAELSKARSPRFYDSMFVLASVVCLVLFLVQDQAAFAFVGYGLLLCRQLYLMAEAGRWNADFRSIFAKYDAKLRELSAATNTEHPQK